MPETQEKPIDPSKSLTPEDIKRLIKSPFEKKVDITQKIAKYYNQGGFDTNQMEIAEVIFRTLVKDTEVEVRKALSDAIKDIDSIPRDVIKELAADVSADVSLPILEFSDVLTDADLVEIVTNTEDVQKQKSISRRKNVSSEVSEALVETNNEEVVGTLLQNETAAISSDSYNKIVETFADAEEIMGSVVQRDALPIEVMERLAEKVSKAVYDKLAEKHADVIQNMEKVIQQTREVATMKMIGLRDSKQEFYLFRQLMEKLRISDDLAPIYALCMGNIPIFEVYMARLTHTPVLNIRTLVADTSDTGFRALYSRAKLPEELYQPIEILVDVLRDMEKELQQQQGIYLSIDAARRIIKKVRERAKGRPHMDELEYVVSLIEHNAMVLDKR